MQFEFGGALCADAEERLVELRLDDPLRFLGDALADRLAFGGEVPDDLAVLLDEVGVALRVVDDHVDRACLVAHILVGGGLGERGFGLRWGELADARELEQPLRVRLGFAGEPRQLGEAGADERDR